MSFKFCVKLYVRRGRQALRLGHCGTAVMLRRDFQALRLGTAVMLRRGFQALLGTALVAMLSLASGVTLLFDDLSSVIFRQSTEPPPKFSIFRG